MRKYLAGALLAAAISVAPTLSRAAETRIAVIDLQKIETESKAGLEARDAFSKEVDARTKVVSAKEESLRLLDEEYRKERDNLSPQQRTEREDRLSKEARAIKRLRDDTNEELQKKATELRSKNLKEISSIVKKAAEDGKFTLILDKRQTVYAPDSIDITTKVMDAYNASRKGAEK